VKNELCVQNFGRRAIATARHLTQKTKHAMSNVPSLPGMLQPVRDLVSNSVAGSANVSTDAVIAWLLVCQSGW